MILSFISYQFLQIFMIPFALAYLVIRKIKGKSVFGKLSERMGFVPKPNYTKQIYWIHAVSVGEVLSIQSLITDIKTKIPNSVCYLTCGTPTGKKIAQEKLDCDHVSFLPYDLLPCMLLAYKRINPKSIIIIEAELWPNLLMLAHMKQIPVYALNARMSKRSKDKYYRFKHFLLPLLQIFKMFYTQSEYDKNEFSNLGVEKEKLTVLGDIKAYNFLKKWEAQQTPLVSFDTLPNGSTSNYAKATTDSQDKRYLDSSLFDPIKTITLLVGSLHPGELDVYLYLFTKLKPKYPNLKLIIAPRHFHWKKELIEKIKTTGYDFFVWDETQKPACTPDILLVCKLGELFGLYKQATIYFLGGTFVPIGGHNLLEPAVWGKPTIIGPYHFNCHVTAQGLETNNALFVVENKEELLTKVDDLLQHPKVVEQMGRNARSWLKGQAKQVETKLATIIEKLKN